MRKWGVVLLAVTMVFGSISMAFAAANPMDAWKPAFDPSGAKYKVIVSNVNTPLLKGAYAGLAIRDELWKRTNGQMYYDFKPFSQLGGEVEVLNLLQTGAIQGMACSSVASTNMGPRMGLVNLPFLINTFEKMEKFVANKELFQPFLDGMKHQGIMGVNVTGYGQYGWATTIPVRNLEDAKKVKFRIAEAAVNRLSYKVWGLNPVVMPWPDVYTSLKQGVITGLDHSPVVVSLNKFFEVTKYFTQLNYAQGLFIWLYNDAYIKSLPPDLAKTLIDVTNEKCNEMRAATKLQQEEEIAKGKKAGVEFINLSDEDMKTLKTLSKQVHDEYAGEIGADYLKKVQDFMGFQTLEIYLMD